MTSEMSFLTELDASPLGCAFIIPFNFLYFIFRGFDIWGLADPGDFATYRPSQFLEIVNNPLANWHTCHMQTNLFNAHISATSPLVLHCYTFSLITGDPVRKLGKALVHLSPLKLFRLLILSQLPLPGLSHRNHRKSFCLYLPLPPN